MCDVFCVKVNQNTSTIQGDHLYPLYMLGVLWTEICQLPGK